jgi:hypothetical protein
MYVFCVYPAMSKKSENLSDLDKMLEWHKNEEILDKLLESMDIVCVTLFNQAQLRNIKKQASAKILFVHECACS